MTRDAPSENPPSRLRVVRDVLVFLIKLWLEGFKDLALMPLSLGAALVDVLFKRKKGRGALYAVMKLGARFERWVNLYGALGEGSNPAHRSSATDASAEGSHDTESSRDAGPTAVASRGRGADDERS